MLIYLQMLDTAEERSRFEQLYRHYRGLMYHVAYQLLANEADAEDAVHQAFVYIAEHFEKISEPFCTKTQSYVVIIVESRSLDLLRQRRRRAAVPLEEGVAGSPVTLPEGSALAAAIVRLSPRQRELIPLKYAYGYTNDECARLLGLSYHGVHSLDQRARARLKELLREEGITV